MASGVSGSAAANQLCSHVRATIPGLTKMQPPPGYPDSLGLCVLDSIWSVGVRYSGVTNVLGRYEELRGIRAHTDSANELLGVIKKVGGPSAFADKMKNHQRTSSRAGILKAQAVQEAAAALVKHRVNTCSDLAKMVPTAQGDTLEHEWRAIPGQRYGITWTYLQMLAGMEEVKPDRMIRRYVASAVGAKTVAQTYAADLVKEAAICLGVSLRLLDHAIWQYQRGLRKTRSARCSITSRRP